MVQPTFLNIVIIGLSMVIFTFLWRMAASALAKKSPDSGLAQAMNVIL